MVRLLFNDIQAFSNGLYLQNRLNGFLVAEVSLSSTIKPAIVQMFFKNMTPFGDDSSDRSNSEEQHALHRQRRSIGCIRNVFWNISDRSAITFRGLRFCSGCHSGQRNLEDLDVAEAPTAREPAGEGPVDVKALKPVTRRRGTFRERGDMLYHEPDPNNAEDNCLHYTQPYQLLPDAEARWANLR